MNLSIQRIGLTDRKNGFALISSLMIMMLLMMVALAMLSLSNTSTRTSDAGRGITEARANARMALMLAIGRLQEQMGPDQRISANSDILDDPATPANEVTNPHWTGVWSSWKAGAGENSQHSTIGVNDEMSPTYLDDGRSDYFQGWLLSLNPDGLSANNALNVALPTRTAIVGKSEPDFGDPNVQLVGRGSIGEGPTRELDYVSARLLSVTDPSDASTVTGRYGWWVGDESQKGRLMADSYQQGSLTAADKIFRSQAPGSMGTKSALGLTSITNEQDINKLPSMKTLDLIDLSTTPAPAVPKLAQLNFHNSTIHSKGVLADVREGGLKRDLSTILEQPIRPEDNGEEFMLYEFDDPRFTDSSNSRVPIQDLAAYYQLYDDDPSWADGRRSGVKYNSTELASSIQIETPDFDGGVSSREKYQGAYTTLYRQPVITKVQFILALGGKKVTGEPGDGTGERQQILQRSLDRDVQNAQRASETPPQVTPYDRSLIQPMNDTDTHRLLLGMTPVITLWNPNNVPMVMTNSQILRFTAPPFALRWKKYRADGTTYFSDYFNLNYVVSGFQNGTNWKRSHILNYRLAGDQTIIFEPGEVKMFSPPTTAGSTLKNLGDPTIFNLELLEPENTWNPNALFLAPRCCPIGGWSKNAPDAYDFNFDEAGKYQNIESLVFGLDDRISLEVIAEEAPAGDRDGRRASGRSEIFGSGFNLSMTDEGFYNGLLNLDFFRHYQMLTRHGGFYQNNEHNLSDVEARQSEFNGNLITLGFPNGVGLIPFKDRTNSMKCETIVNSTLLGGELIGLMDFSLSYGCEARLNTLAGFGGGRRIASRPFLHGGLNAPPFFDKFERNSLYNYGWDWQLNTINNVEDSIVQGEVDPSSADGEGTGRGYFGGGYTIEAGTTHVVQREIPALPPISIASFSHAHLGGFSLARGNLLGENPDTDDFSTTEWNNHGSRIRNPTGTDYQQITAMGSGGLTPHVVQAIGNSYAHPNVPSNRAFITDWERYFDAEETPVNVPFADHSYLANKALWDEYFFSSIAPQPASVPLFGGTPRTAQEVATQFFSNSSMLPNRRLTARSTGLDSTTIADMFDDYDVYQNGFADKIAAHLMVNGSFNINSTSKGAWKILFTSLKGKPSVFLESGVTPGDVTLPGTVVSPGSLPTASPVPTDPDIDFDDPPSANDPPEQWLGGRELSDEDIDNLATAMVKQVKLRGPFLSLSEFINRRLDNNSDGFAEKGSLQAALDEEGSGTVGQLNYVAPVQINALFRKAGRVLDTETAAIDFAFPAAATGPIAYGSAAYVDQADILRGLAGQLTPRGDTFVIRTYGDSLGKNGQVIARAWCEAVVQRLPAYLNSADAPHIKQADLASEENKRFGRKLKIISFRWLSAEDI